MQECICVNKSPFFSVNGLQAMFTKGVLDKTAINSVLPPAPHYTCM